MRFEEFQQIQVGTKIVHQSYIEKSSQNIFLSPESQIRKEPSSGCCNVTRRLHILFFEPTVHKMDSILLKFKL